MTEKTCKTCGNTKSVDAFRRQRRVCKTCVLLREASRQQEQSRRQPSVAKGSLTEATCKDCSQTLGIEQFAYNVTHGYYYRSCKTCRRQRDNETQRDRYRNEPEYRRIKKARSLATYRRRKSA